MDEERRSMKKHKEHYEKLQCVTDSVYGIPKRCACGGRIVDDVDPEEGVDTLPGTRFFTCIEYQKDGLHYKQPWVLAIQEEVERLVRREEDGQKLRRLVTELTTDCEKLREEVEILTMRVSDLERVL